MQAMLDTALLPAWEDSVHAAQATFRAVLTALAQPGTIRTVPPTAAAPAPLEPATTALLLALADLDTNVWLDAGADNAAVQSYLRFHGGCPFTAEPQQAAFAVITQPAWLALDDFPQGTPEYPDRSATLIVQVPSLEDGPLRVLSGPGIRDTAPLRVAGLPEDFMQRWRRNTAGFPLGVDLVFTCGDRLVGLPRTTQVREQATCM